MIAIVDYGVGNLFSLKSSFAAIGAEAVVATNCEELRAAAKIVLPVAITVAKTGFRLLRSVPYRQIGQGLLAAARRVRRK